MIYYYPSGSLLDSALVCSRDPSLDCASQRLVNSSTTLHYTRDVHKIQRYHIYIYIVHMYIV